MLCATLLGRAGCCTARVPCEEPRKLLIRQKMPYGRRKCFYPCSGWRSPLFPACSWNGFLFRRNPTECVRNVESQQFGYPSQPRATEKANGLHMPTADEIRDVMAALGRVKSAAKAAAARRNGALGGRPRKKKAPKLPPRSVVFIAAGNQEEK